MAGKRKERTIAIDEAIGLRLRQKRLERGFSQEKLGEFFGVSFQQVQKYEKGSNRIAASTLVMFAEVLGVPITYFFDKLGTGVKSQSREDRGRGEFLASRQGADLVAACSGLPAPVVRNLASLAESLPR